MFTKDTPSDREFSLSFKVTDPYLASYVLGRLLYKGSEDFNMGIDVKSIYFRPVIDKETMRNQLHQAIDNIINQEE